MRIINSVKSIQDEPMKWKKHLILVALGLRDMDHLLQSIKRYPINEYAQCLSDIENELTKNTNVYSFIIKLVYHNIFYKLPNIVISSASDLELAKKKLEKIELMQFKEIWYCKNQTKNNGIVFGRMLINDNPLFPNRCPIRYEMVWGASAREIENYPFIKESFISIDQNNWNAIPQVDRIQNKDMSVNEVLYISNKIITTISHYNTEIIDFATFVFSCGCSHLCLEFNYGDNTLSFIDWDSEDDKKVLDAYYS